MLIERTALALTLISTLLISLLLVASAPSLKATSGSLQPRWSKTYGAYRADSFVQTADGGFAVAGENATESFRGYSGYLPLLIKTDSSGKMEWGKTYGAEFGVDGDALSVVQTEDLGYALCGMGWLLKTDSQGNVQWNKTYGQLEPFTAIQASDGGYVMTAVYNFDNGQYVPELLKTDANGNLLWNKTFGTASADAQINAVMDTDDGYAMAGSLTGDFWLVKTDYNSNLLWNKTYHYASPRQRGPQRFHSVDNTADGGYILSGEDAGSAWLIKTSADGEEQWNFNYVGGESGSSAFMCAVELADGGYVATGFYNSRALLVKTDSSGNYLWNATYGQGDGDRASSALAANDGGFVVAGALDNNVWLAKFPSNLVSLQTEQLIIIAAVVVAVIGAGLGFLIYLIKRK